MSYNSIANFENEMNANSDVANNNLEEQYKVASENYKTHVQGLKTKISSIKGKPDYLQDLDDLDALSKTPALKRTLQSARKVGQEARLAQGSALVKKTKPKPLEFEMDDLSQKPKKLTSLEIKRKQLLNEEPVTGVESDVKAGDIVEDEAKATRTAGQSLSDAYNVVKLGVTDRVGSAVQGVSDTVRGVSSGENILKTAKGTVELGEDAAKGASKLGKLAGKASGLLDGVNGALAVGSDIDGLLHGKSLAQSMGDNTDERISNGLAIAGTVALAIPVVGEVAAPILDIGSAILGFLGEKKAVQKKLTPIQTQLSNAKPPPKPTLHTSVNISGMGQLNNMAKPQDMMIQGNGAF